MATLSCPQCDAPASGWVCEYCGTLTHKAADASQEQTAVNEFHLHVAKQDVDTQVKLLKHGFLPDTALGLIDAGTRCVSLIDLEHPADELVSSAAHRLNAITIKLRTLHPSSTTETAVREFESIVQQQRQADQKLTREGLILIGVLLLVCIGASLFIWFANT